MYIDVFFQDVSCQNKANMLQLIIVKKMIKDGVLIVQQKDALLMIRNGLEFYLINHSNLFNTVRFIKFKLSGAKMTEAQVQCDQFTVVRLSNVQTKQNNAIQDHEREIRLEDGQYKTKYVGGNQMPQQEANQVQVHANMEKQKLTEDSVIFFNKKTLIVGFVTVAVAILISAIIWSVMKKSNDPIWIKVAQINMIYPNNLQGPSSGIKMTQKQYKGKLDGKPYQVHGQVVSQYKEVKSEEIEGDKTRVLQQNKTSTQITTQASKSSSNQIKAQEPTSKPQEPKPQNSKEKAKTQVPELAPKTSSAIEICCQRTKMCIKITSLDLNANIIAPINSILEMLINNYNMAQNLKPKTNKKALNKPRVLQGGADIKENGNGQVVADTKQRSIQFYDVIRLALAKVSRTFEKTNTEASVSLEQVLEKVYNQQTNQFEPVKTVTTETKNQILSLIQDSQIPKIQDIYNQRQVAQAVAKVIDIVLKKAKKILQQAVPKINQESGMQLPATDDSRISIFADQPSDVQKMCQVMGADRKIVRCNDIGWSSGALPVSQQAQNASPAIAIFTILSEQ